MPSRYDWTLSKLNRLKKKGFRDAYVKAHVEQGLAHQIRAIRNQRGLSQKELAEKLGGKQPAVARLEDPSYGKYSLATLEQLAAAFDVALLVRFVPYSRFLEEVADVSPAGLSADSFETECRAIEACFHAAAQSYGNNYLQVQNYRTHDNYSAVPVESKDGVFF